MSDCTVCFPMTRFEVGGLEKVQMEIASGLIKSDFQVELVVRSVSDQAQKMLGPEIPITILKGGKLSFLYRLMLWIRNKKPFFIVVSANDIGCFLLLLCKLFLPNTKIIWTQHLSLSGPLKVSKGVRKFKLLAEVFLMRAMIKKSDAIVAVSNAVADDMRNLLDKSLNIQVIYNPVITRDFDKKINQIVQWPWEDRAHPTIIFVGRLVKIKRLDLLIQAFSMCIQSAQARLLIIGDGPEACNAAELAESLVLREACKFIGHQENPLPWISGSDLLVLCSDSEGFGLVLVEAMACGTQVLSTDCPDGPSELLAKGKYGRLVPTGDVSALAFAIAKSLKTPLVTEDMLKARAVEFNVERAVTQYISLFKTVQGG